jgi:hypothetical protein
MLAPKLAFFLGITLVALLTLTKGVPRHQNSATAATAPAIFQKMMPVAQIAAPLWLPKKLLAFVFDPAYNLK